MIHDEKFTEDTKYHSEDVSFNSLKKSPVDESHLSESEVTFAPSIIGPELIMPGISDDMATQGSWVIPKERRRKPKSEISQSSTAKKSPKKSRNAKVANVELLTKVGEKNELVNRGRFKPPGFLLLFLNVFLLLTILHLLVVPELLYRWPSVCQSAQVSALYRETCKYISLDTQFKPHQLPATINKYAQFENFLNEIYGSLSPHEAILKRTESDLREILKSLQAADFDARNEISLEYDSAWSTLRQSSREFDSILSELRTSVDSLQSIRLRAIQKLNSGKHKGQPTLLDVIGRRLSFKRPAASTSYETSRLDQLLEKTISSLALGTSPLLEHLLALDNHLVFMKQITIKETRTGTRDRTYSKNTSNSISDIIDALRLAISESFSRLLPGRGLETCDIENASIQKLYNLIDQLNDIISKHKPITEIVGALDKELKTQKNIRGISI